MRKIISIPILILSLTITMVSCNNDKKDSGESTTNAATSSAGQEAVKDDVSQKDIVKIAVGSKDHTTLVAALQQADYVKVLANAGPFTVFAPTNAAFTQVLSALSLSDINNIPMPTLLAVLRYHVVGGRAFSSDLANGNLAMLAGGNTTINLTNGSGGGPTIKGNGNGANLSNIVGTNLMCRNGVVHVIDRVLLP